MNLELFQRLPVPPGIFAVLVGAALVLAGRRIFWLALGAAAFTAGALLSTYLPVQLEAGGRLVLALLCALVGVLIASFIRRTGVALGGFLIGALAGFYLAQAYSPGVGGILFLGSGIGALVGWVLARRLVNAALIILSSLMGAMLLVQQTPLTQPLAGGALLVLCLGGIALQSRGRKRKR